MTAPVIEVDHLTKTFGSLTAVDDVSMEVHPGEVFAFLGPNGAGKSTTIRTLMDFIRPTDGACRVLGLDSRRDSVEIKRRVGFLPSDLALYPNLTGHQTIEYFAHLRGGVDWTWVEQLAGRIDADLSRKVGDYSTGNRQKLGVVLAFMHRPEVAILDEPITGLDPLVQQELHALMREQADEGKTVFLSSHTMSEVERVADRVAFIRRGVLVALEDMASLRAKATRSVTIEFPDHVAADAFAGLPSVLAVDSEGHAVTVEYEGELAPVMKVAADRGALAITSGAVDLDALFLKYYRDDEAA